MVHFGAQGHHRKSGATARALQITITATHHNQELSLCHRRGIDLTIRTTDIVMVIIGGEESLQQRRIDIMRGTKTYRYDVVQPIRHLSCRNSQFHVLMNDAWTTNLNNGRFRAMTVSRRCSFCSDGFAQFSPSNDIWDGGTHANDTVGQRRSVGNRLNKCHRCFVILCSPLETCISFGKILVDNAAPFSIGK